MGGTNPDDDEGSLDSDSDLILDGENDSEDSDDDGNMIQIFPHSTKYAHMLDIYYTYIHNDHDLLHLLYRRGARGERNGR